MHARVPLICSLGLMLAFGTVEAQGPTLRVLSAYRRDTLALADSARGPVRPVAGAARSHAANPRAACGLWPTSTTISTPSRANDCNLPGRSALATPSAMAASGTATSSARNAAIATAALRSCAAPARRGSGSTVS